IESLPMPGPPEWPALHADALYGLAGEIVQAIAPHTEADPAAVLAQLLVMFGNAVGTGPHFPLEGDNHRANLFVCLVGRSSRARKGTSRGRVLQVFRHADADWCKNNLVSGLSSGEGVIWAVRDAVYKREAVKEKGRVTGHEEVEADPGVSDKRLLVEEGE